MKCKHKWHFTREITTLPRGDRVAYFICEKCGGEKRLEITGVIK